jgi:hypothetical protein
MARGAEVLAGMPRVEKNSQLNTDGLKAEIGAKSGTGTFSRVKSKRLKLNRALEFKEWSRLSGLNRRPTVYKIVVNFSTMRKLQQICGYRVGSLRAVWQV